MDLETQIRKFIKQPFPLWETNLTQQLTKHKWNELQKQGLNDKCDYSTSRIWLHDFTAELSKKIVIDGNNVCLEMPSLQVQSFYDEHGLELLTEYEIEADVALLKIKNGISILRLIEPAYDCITNLVRSIQILRQPDAEIDLSYSHPNLPFSIFVSVCEDDSTISNLRVAESILHEAMHLKLTLIENIVPLVHTNTRYLYYSPWRNEKRPVQGILHGLFVFRAIHDFYLAWIKKKRGVKINDYLNSRIKNIRLEIALLKNLYKHISLTEEGRSLTLRLCQLYP